MSDHKNIGYRGATACTAAGISYRQLDYWARTGLVEPTVRSAAGSGTQRLYVYEHIRRSKKLFHIYAVYRTRP